jgi:hypothetical protein
VWMRAEPSHLATTEELGCGRITAQGMCLTDHQALQSGEECGQRAGIKRPFERQVANSRYMLAGDLSDAAKSRSAS